MDKSPPPFPLQSFTVVWRDTVGSFKWRDALDDPETSGLCVTHGVRMSTNERDEIVVDCSAGRNGTVADTLTLVPGQIVAVIPRDVSSVVLELWNKDPLLGRKETKALEKRIGNVDAAIAKLLARQNGK